MSILTPGRKRNPPGAYIIAKPSAWLCIMLTFAAGISTGFALCALAVADKF